MQKNKNQTLYNYVALDDQKFIDQLLDTHHLSFQNFKFICEVAIDLRMWQEKFIGELWSESVGMSVSIPYGARVDKVKSKEIFNRFREKYFEIRNCLKEYSAKALELPKREPAKIVDEKSDKNIFGDCPVASPKTVCCNLKTLDVVQRCGYGCSYCIIDTFYSGDIVFDSKIDEKLAKIELDPDKFYHIGTGQSSDALAWGNRNGILDKLCDFAKNNANVLLEFKTKSDNVSYLKNNKIPDNVACSWTLNTETIIKHEEFYTPTLEARLEAARKVADCGVKVAFHFHPMVYYKGWEEEYAGVAKIIQKMFKPQEIAFISFGSVTFIKPAIKNIRKKGGITKILQMDIVPDPHGRLTYPDEIKIKMFKSIYDDFSLWKEKIFFYLCMEKAEIWDGVFGWHYASNKEFEKEFF